MVASPFLITKSQHLGGANVIGTIIFAMTMVFLYLTSTLYHALPNGRAKQTLLSLIMAQSIFLLRVATLPLL
jgi:hemolysin III